MKDSRHLSSDRDSVAPGATSVTLLGQVRQGDPRAWERFVKLYRPLVLWWCQNRLGSPQDAEDVTQDVFTAVWSKIGDFTERRHTGSLRAWMKQITTFKLHEHWNRAGKEPAGAGGTDAQQRMAQLAAAPAVEADLAADPVERTILLRAAVDQLLRAEFAPTTLEAFWQTAVAQRAPREVAKELGLSTGAVYIAKSRVLTRLRQVTGDVLD